ncbi:pyroglutamyl-peptidase I family protein [Arthrobacter globiformis]|uniref:pyroglutamyl-peptidase I family protein n=1 Tax=Arthrobacter globiformis TaxID=1665 RepID=UPI00358F1786
MFPAEISRTAGTYVCNHTFYTLMHELAPPAGRPGWVRPCAVRPRPGRAGESCPVSAPAAGSLH